MPVRAGFLQNKALCCKNGIKIKISMCHMKQSIKFFLLLVIVFNLSACSSTNTEWLFSNENKSMEHSSWIFIPNEPFAAQRRFNEGWAK